LTIFNYRTIGAGEIVGSDETEVIQIAKDYGVAPLMSLSTLTYQGTSNIEVVYSILYNEEAIELHINAILGILREKGYYGINMSLSQLNQQTTPAYDNFITKLSSRLKAEGFILFVTLIPRVVITANEITYERADYTVLGREADYLQILSYGWGSSVGPPSATTPAFLSRLLLENAVTMVPPEKLFTGISVIGYNWQGPYIIGVTRANALTTDAAIELALLTGSTIMFEERSQAPYYEYYTSSAGTTVRHIVWFSDARTIDALMKFVPEFGIQGAGIWNIMNYFDQMWLVINSQYGINKVLPEI
jgi:spore germination protein